MKNPLRSPNQQRQREEDLDKTEFLVIYVRRNVLFSPRNTQRTKPVANVTGMTVPNNQRLSGRSSSSSSSNSNSNTSNIRALIFDDTVTPPQSKSVNTSNLAYPRRGSANHTAALESMPLAPPNRRRRLHNSYCIQHSRPYLPQLSSADAPPANDGRVSFRFSWSTHPEQTGATHAHINGHRPISARRPPRVFFLASAGHTMLHKPRGQTALLVDLFFDRLPEHREPADSARARKRHKGIAGGCIYACVSCHRKNPWGQKSHTVKCIRSLLEKSRALKSGQARWKKPPGIHAIDTSATGSETPCSDYHVKLSIATHLSVPSPSSSLGGCLVAESCTHALCLNNTLHKRFSLVSTSLSDCMRYMALYLD